MIKPEWGSKQTCPKCGTRFYDLGEDDPATCIECGEKFQPEPVLKSKQPLPFEEVKKAGEKDKKDDDSVADDDLDIDIDDDGDTADADVDLDTDDDLGVSRDKGDESSDDT